MNLYELLGNKYRSLLVNYQNICRDYGKQGDKVIERNRHILKMLSIIDSVTPQQQVNKAFIEACFVCPPSYPTKIFFCLDEATHIRSKEFFSFLRPRHVVGYPKVRIGGAHDGGYIMVNPQLLHSNIAYSFGVSDYSPWDIEIAKMGLHVFQYDGTINTPPDIHENIKFYRYNICADDMPGDGWKNLTQILKENGHKLENNITLQIDIEGGEWDFFEKITEDQLLKFSQIIVEFHGLSPLDKENFEQKLHIIKRILKTHEVIHLHSNNFCDYFFFKDFSFCPELIEVSFLRRDKLIKFEDKISFSGTLDSPNQKELPDPQFIF